MIKHILTAATLLCASSAWAGPAENVATSTRFFENLNAGDMTAWLGTMAADVVTYEPVGMPANKGHEGVMAWAANNAAMGFKSVQVDVHSIHPTPAENAIVWTTTFVLPNDEAVEIQGVDIHRFNADGLIEEVRAFFDPTPLMAAMGQ